jgi:hypothetical protein
MFALCLAPSAQAGLILDIATTPGADVEFTGSGNGAAVKNKNDGAGQANVDTSTSGVGDAFGLFGSIGGSYSYTTASITNPFPGVQFAPLSTSGGSLTITDASNLLLTGTIAGIDIATVGTGGALNLDGVINLTAVSYSGTNADLVQLRNEALTGGGTVTISFQFASVTNLSQLAALGADSSTSYSGTITTASVPEPSTFALGGIGAIAVMGIHLRKRGNLRKAIPR